MISEGYGNSKFIEETMEWKCRSFDFAEVRSAQDDRIGEAEEE